MYLEKRRAAFFCVLSFVALSAALAVAMSRKPPEPAYVPGQVILKFHEGVSQDRSARIVAMEGCRIKTVLKRTGLHLVLLPEGVGVEDAVERFLEYPEVLSAEPNYRAEPMDDQ